jgi:hypothetical protein
LSLLKTGRDNQPSRLLNAVPDAVFSDAAASSSSLASPSNNSDDLNISSSLPFPLDIPSTVADSSPLPTASGN